MKLLLDQHLTKAAQFHLASLLMGKDNGFVQITNSFLQFEILKVSKLEGLLECLVLFPPLESYFLKPQSSF